LSNLQLFVACVAIWGSTWFAIKFQLGVASPEASVAFRFLAASLMLHVYCRARGLSLRFPVRVHAWIALQGLLMFGASYVFVYHAERHLASGLVAVGYSMSPLLGMLGQRLFLGTPMTTRVAAGSLLGIGGIALVFAPEITLIGASGPSLAGVVFTALSVVISTLGSVVAHRNQAAGLSVWQTMALGMLWGSGLAAALNLAGGHSFAFSPTPSYLFSLAYLAICGSVLAFAGYLTLIGRIGAARASYVGVMVPIIALTISSVFEGFRWQPLTWAGMAVSLAGNVLVLAPGRPPAARGEAQGGIA
jgi:drug/metabolite transporter (DMT)-like permease